MKRFIVLFLSLTLAASGFAEERILDYDSRIVVNPDSTVLVTETYRVRAEGRRIRHGIYREFPRIMSTKWATGSGFASM